MLSEAIVIAPWIEGQLQSLTNYQKSGFCHPFTGIDYKDGSSCILIPTKNGWIKEIGGEVIQDWAWRFMVDWSWKRYLGINLFSYTTHY